MYRDRGLRRCWPGLLALLLWLPAAMAASTDTPRAHALIQQYGSDVGGRLIPAFRAIYKEYLREAGHAKADKVADIAYGAHELQRLDVFAPMAADAPAPVLLFVHGGGFVSGDKGDGEIYDNVLDYFAARG
ncbi:MAG TPA: hypothetical protein VFE85_08935, partial [Woeseiaceae bacterium]|nr:hypothetical protein [Woeseiaceae bacterium]